MHFNLEKVKDSVETVAQVVSIGFMLYQWRWMKKQEKKRPNKKKKKSKR